MNSKSVKIVDRPHKPYKTNEEYSSKIRSGLDAETKIAIEAIDYLVNTRLTKGYLNEGFEDWESFFCKAGRMFPFAQPNFVLEMMTQWESGDKAKVAQKMWDKIVAHTLERVNQGDN